MATTPEGIDEDKLLESMIDQMNESIRRANPAMDKALEFIEASNRRIAAMEGKAAAKNRT